MDGIHTVGVLYGKGRNSSDAVAIVGRECLEVGHHSGTGRRVKTSDTKNYRPRRGDRLIHFYVRSPWCKATFADYINLSHIVNKDLIPSVVSATACFLLLPFPC